MTHNIGGQDRLTLKSITAYDKIGNVDYMIYLKSSFFYNQNKDRVFEAGKIIFENEAGRNSKF